MNIEQIFNLVFVLGALLLFLFLGLKQSKSLKTRLILVILTALPIALFVITTFAPGTVFTRETIQNYVLKLGVWSVLGLLLLQVIQVIIPPLDHNVVGMIGGFLFGPWLGFVYNLTGRVTGSLIAFFLARKYGRPFVARFVSIDQLEKYDKMWNKSLSYVFLAYWFPFFPDDTISYLAGVSKVNLRIFVIMLLLGHPTGTLGISFTGSLGMTRFVKSPLSWVIAIGTLVVGLLLFFWQQRRLSRRSSLRND